jgi:UDP-N-acetylmuramyl pentapeptide phosphotransferase/UDP-N-acetylglucosamine-1-phosphate transferase
MNPKSLTFCFPNFQNEDTLVSMIYNATILITFLLLTSFITWRTLVWLKHRFPDGFLASPVQSRSNHKQPVRQLGGLAVAPVACLSTLAIMSATNVSTFLAILPLSLFAMIFLLGLVDDWRGVDFRIRFAIQLAVTCCLILLLSCAGKISGFDTALKPALVTHADAANLAILALLTVFVVYWTNITNFMDGMDLMLVVGLTLPLITISTLLAVSAGSVPFLPAIGLSTGFALAGFALHNKPPASIFMGDSGSLFCGLVAGLLIVSGAFQLSPVTAILPFAFFLADATFTLVKRLLEGENIFAAHSNHAYQLAFRGGMQTGVIITKVAGLTGLLCLLSVIAHTAGTVLVDLIAALLGSVLTAGLVRHLRNAAAS